jgi:Tfp pilus assembly protein PilV
MSGWEITAYVASIVLLMTASSIIWHSSSGVGLKLIESLVALLVVGAVGTTALVKLRFRS